MRVKAVKCIETGKTYRSITEAASAVFISYTAILAVLKGRQRTAAGCHWVYVCEEVSA